MVESLLAKGANVNGEDKEGVTPLMKAALAGHVVTVRILIAHGSNVNAITSVRRAGYGQTALMNAAMMGHRELVELLVENGADVNARDEWYGDTALILSVIMGHVDIARFLLEHGAEVNVWDNYGYETHNFTALDWAVRKNFVELSRLLEAYGGKQR